MSYHAAHLGDVILEVSAVAKAYGETRALTSCSLTLRRGEILVLMGENGSGKSTLIKILSGLVRPDRGEIIVDGSRHPGFASPSPARRLGIATVFQEVLLVPGLSVLDNVQLGLDGLVRRRGQLVGRRARIEAYLARLLDQQIDLDAPVGSLGLGVGQVCAVVRALMQAPRVLLLDEATSALDFRVRDRLFEIIQELKTDGVATAFISHRMDEVETIADRVTVLRSGSTVSTLERSQATPETLVRLMSGVEAQSAVERANGSAHNADASFAIGADGVVLREGAKPFDAKVRSGEVVGLGGLEGHGQEVFLQTLAGLVRPLAGGVVAIKEGARRAIVTANDAASIGVAYVPRDRKAEGIFAPLSVLDNFVMPSISRDSRWGLLSVRGMIRRYRTFAQAFAIKASRPSLRITSLSGGNQQKVIIARWLATEPRVLLLNDPTRGVDHATKQDIYARLHEIAARGIAIVMLSTEVDELLTLMDRVMVFREGALFTEFGRDDLDRQRLIASFFGREHRT
jgi:ABC-type sugar transport system ATPase subunit